jgi:hypothetical protein
MVNCRARRLIAVFWLDALLFWLAWAALWLLADLPRRRRQKPGVADEAEAWLRKQRKQ